MLVLVLLALRLIKSRLWHELLVFIVEIRVNRVNLHLLYRGLLLLIVEEILGDSNQVRVLLLQINVCSR